MWQLYKRVNLSKWSKLELTFLHMTSNPRNYHANHQPTQNQIKTELPDWLQNNNFILNGYRPQLKSYRLCILSWFRLHTETGNIWTHLIAFIASLAYLAYYMSLTIGADFEFDTFFILFYFAAAINCWLFSGTGSNGRYLIDLIVPSDDIWRSISMTLNDPKKSVSIHFDAIHQES